MSKEIKAPVYSYEDLRRKADEFLAQYHRAGTIPVPIEEIVEFELKFEVSSQVIDKRLQKDSVPNDLQD